MPSPEFIKSKARIDSALSAFDFRAEEKRIDDGIKSERVFIVKPDVVGLLAAAIQSLRVVQKQFESTPLQVPFGSETARRDAWERSKDHPEEYFRFSAFGVDIAVAHVNVRQHDVTSLRYCVAVFGYVPHSDHFVYVRGYQGRHMYFNPSEDMDSAIADWYMCVVDFLRFEIGIRLTDRGEFDFDPPVGGSL